MSGEEVGDREGVSDPLPPPIPPPTRGPAEKVVLPALGVFEPDMVGEVEGEREVEWVVEEQEERDGVGVRDLEKVGEGDKDWEEHVEREARGVLEAEGEGE